MVDRSQQDRRATLRRPDPSARHRVPCVKEGQQMVVSGTPSPEGLAEVLFVAGFMIAGLLIHGTWSIWRLGAKSDTAFPRGCRLLVVAELALVLTAVLWPIMQFGGHETFALVGELWHGGWLESSLSATYVLGVASPVVWAIELIAVDRRNKDASED
jgi:hypothetical protein